MLAAAVYLDSTRARFVIYSPEILLTSGFSEKEPLRPTPEWNTRFFFAFSKRTQLWLYLRFEENEKIPLGRLGKKFAQLAVSI